MKAVFLDRDGTITVGAPQIERVDSPDKVTLLPHSFDALQVLAGLDYGIFIVTNQAGIAEGRITLKQFESINDKVLSLIKPTGIKVLKTYVCPHSEKDNCDCIKPKPKMLLDAAREFDIEPSDSWMIGDRVTDVLTGINAGTKAILVKTGALGHTSQDATFTAENLLEAVRYLMLH